MDWLQVTGSILTMSVPLVALPFAVRDHPHARGISVLALFGVPLLADVAYLAWHWKGGPSAQERLGAPFDTAKRGRLLRVSGGLPFLLKLFARSP